MKSSTGDSALNSGDDAAEGFMCLFFIAGFHRSEELFGKSLDPCSPHLVSKSSLDVLSVSLNGRSMGCQFIPPGSISYLIPKNPANNQKSSILSNCLSGKAGKRDKGKETSNRRPMAINLSPLNLYL